jgi:hypothetical protein
MMRGKNISEDYIEKLLTIYQCGTRISSDSQNMAQLIEAALQDSDRHRPYRQAYFNWVFGEKGMDRQRQLIQHLQQYAA